MKFFADESVDYPIVVRLREDGHDVFAVAEITPSIPDEAVFTEANQRGDLLLSADKDFGEIVFRQRKITAGVVLIRLAGLLPETKAKIVSVVVRDREAELPGAFTVISPGIVRIRPRP